MGCGCKRRSNVKYIWTSAVDPTDTVVYDSEIQARAKTLRQGGTYVKQEK